jgi:hypothetical protein
MASGAPLSSTTPPNGKKIGEDQQLELLALLRSRHQLLGQTYEGALRAYADEGNPESLVQASHSMRELFDALPMAAQIEIKRTADLKEEVQRVSGIWSTALKKTTSLTAGGWTGPIDQILRQLLLQLADFFTWFEEEHPRHGVVRDMALDRLDPGRGELPAQLRKQRGRTLNDLAKYMNQVAHHKSQSSRTEFATKLAECESFLRTYFKPTPLADSKTMDEILKGGE